MKSNGRRVIWKRSRGFPEVKAILLGIAAAYAYLGFAFLLAQPDFEVSLFEYFILKFRIMLVVATQVTWIGFGLFKVSWISTWARISLRGLAFLVPFSIISMCVLFIGKANLWHMWEFWATNVGISCAIAFTLLRPLLNCASNSANPQ